jgi:hypothetical protein
VSKRSRLVARATETARRPEPGRLAADGDRGGYRIVSISLYGDELAWLDLVEQALAGEGLRKASRSGIIQEAIRQLQETLQSENATSAEAIVEFFRRNALRRHRAHLISVQK